ncbi:MAG: hypothetical protein IH568_01420 [Burkholderiaceae bacterium]|jgi:hypothetical protein|nr:hypothetical protein [Burkholderiaceae bacterium]
MAKDRDTEDSREEPRRRGSRIWAALPRRPRFRRSQLRATDEFFKLRDGLRQTRHLCPQDGAPMDLTMVFPEEPDGSIAADAQPYRALVCPECAFTIPISALVEQFQKEAEPLKKAERMFTLFGFVILVVFAGITLLTGNIITILAALMMAMTLFIKALFYRYRHWQAVTGKLFLDAAPVGEWLRYEFGSSTETRDLSVR